MLNIHANEAIKAITFNLSHTVVLSKIQAEDEHWRTNYFAEDSLSMDRNNHYFTALSNVDGSHKSADAGQTFALVFDDPVEFDDSSNGTPLQDLVALIDGPGELSYVLQTSAKKYQAGLLLERNGLTVLEINKLMVAIQALLPEGSIDKGPGVRMARLPGINNKASHVAANGGEAFVSNYTEWRPENRFSVGSLLALVGLTRDELAEMATMPESSFKLDDDHPIFKSSLIEVIEPHPDGGYLIHCPWKEEHTSKDTPALLTISEDRVVGFKCLHGHCADRKGKELLKLIESERKGTMSEVIKYRMEIEDSQILQIREQLTLKTESQLLKEYDEVDIMKAKNIFIGEQNKFYNLLTGVLYSRDAFNQVYGHLDKIPSHLLKGIPECNVDRLTCDFNEPLIFEKGRSRYVNSFDTTLLVQGKEGDASPFVNHVHKLYGEHADRILDYMSYTIRVPGTKINYMVILGGGKGIGKDAILQPLAHHFGRYHSNIETDALFASFNSHLDGTKILIINELSAPRQKESTDIHNHLKNVIAAPPAEFNINQKGLKVYKVPNQVSVMATTNSRTPIPIERESRRFFMAFSDTPATSENQKAASSLYKWYENEDGLAKAIGYLQSRDISGFDPAEAPPVTVWLTETAESSKSNLEHAITEIMDYRGTDSNYIYPPLMSATELRDALKDWKSATQEDMLKIPAANKLSVELGRLGFDLFTHNGKSSDVPRKLWVLRDRKKIAHMRPKEKLALYHPVEGTV